MRTVGELTCWWGAVALPPWPFSVCATFGGDEVIIAAAGGDYVQFSAQITGLAAVLRAEAPRPCSFALGTTAPTRARIDPKKAYHMLVSTVDAALFHLKAELRAHGRAPMGEVVDVGRILLGPISERRS
jgi:hypothetical protein